MPKTGEEGIMIFEKEFKDALLNLPVKEKDKLLLRLLKKDVPLADQLYFELVSTQTVEGRRAELEIMVSKRVSAMSKHRFSNHDLLSDMRSLSGEISKQVKITKDKFGEISLNLLMLNEILEANNQPIAHYSRIKGHKFSLYVLARVFKILILIRAMHEDYLADFRQDLERLGELIQANRLLNQAAIHYGMDLDWLISGEIPEDIKQRQSALKK